MKKSRQQPQKRTPSVQSRRRRYSASVSLKNNKKSTFLCRFEGKINVVNKESGGLLAILMKTVKADNYRYANKSKSEYSRVNTEAFETAEQMRETPRLFQSQQLAEKQNVCNNNNRSENYQPDNQMFKKRKVQQKSVSPFQLPRLNIPKRSVVLNSRDLPKNQALEITFQEKKARKLAIPLATLKKLR